jgi:hypothetical protein
VAKRGLTSSIFAAVTEVTSALKQVQFERQREGRFANLAYESDQQLKVYQTR